MMMDWNTYRKQLLETVGEIGKTSPEITRGYQGLSQAGAKTGKLDAKTRELIVIAIDTLVAWPEPFIDVHIHAAFDAGATIQEVIETIAVTANFGGGHSINHGLVAMERVIKEREEEGVRVPHRRDEKN
jgi:alkylhydroperoxidase/carboxymuconolactone decarboxylase family protein YurZ